MKDEKNKNQEIGEIGEDATKYGEFVSSYFGWVSLEEQKRQAEKLQKITKKKEKQRKSLKKKSFLLKIKVRRSKKVKFCS